jgi:transcription antitermination protein NusB
MTTQHEDADAAECEAEGGVNLYAVKRVTARLAAVQILYQIEMTGKGWEAALREFSEHSFAPDHPRLKSDAALQKAIIEGVVRHQEDIDPAIQAALRENWKLKRLDATVRAILRAGAFELLHGPDVPAPVVVSNYVDIASDFFDDTEAGFVNAALDALAVNVGRKEVKPE